MALTYGIETLAVLNKGGGLRRLAEGQTTQYLRGDMTWTAFPTSMPPEAHNHAASEITSGTLELARLPRIAAGSIYVGAGTSNDILTLAKGSALQALRTNASETALEWYTTQWKDGQYGTGSIKTNSATAAGLRSGDVAKPYVYWAALSGQNLKAGGLAGVEQKWMLISPSTVATYAYGGEEYTYNNATANYVFLLLINNADFIGSATNPFNTCRILANAGTNYLTIYRSITFVGTPIAGNVYPVIVSTGDSTEAPYGINYTESVLLYAPLKTSSDNYSGNYSVASGANSVASGNYSVASGEYSVASGNNSVASGGNSVASGEYSVASGNNSVASGGNSVASGAQSFASGVASVASGYASVASGHKSVASGYYSVASGDGTVASGNNSVASGHYSVASGYYSVASGDYSVASGTGTVASGSSSVASGDNSVASGSRSFASGYFSVASGNYSVALCLYSVASGASQTVIGKYNVADTSSAFIIGNGTSTSARSNCLTVDFSGNMTLGGSIAIGANKDLTIPKHAGLDRLAYFDSAGTLQSSASYTLSSFALENHNHDSTYLKLSGGTVNGTITLGSTGGIYKSGWEGNKIPYFVSGEMVVGTITTDSFALAVHTHSAGEIASGTLSVDHGGTGNSSLTAYAILLGGTTSTGAMQQMLSLGEARQILASSGAGARPQWLNADEYQRFSEGGTSLATAVTITAKTGISEKLVFIDPNASEGTSQTISYFKAPPASGQNLGDRIVIYCCSSDETYKYIVLPNGSENFCDLIGGQYTGNIEASYGNKIELVCLPKSGDKAWYVSRIALINNN